VHSSSNKIEPSKPISHLVITGSNGFVGQAILDFIKNLPREKRPSEITLVSQAKDSSYNLSELNLSVSYLSADLAKPWEFSIPGAHLLNLAADGSANSYSGSSAEKFKQININLIEWARNNTPSLIVHASSGACFGINKLEEHAVETNLLEEGMNVKARFIDSRIFAEQNLFLLNAQHGIPVSICRLFSFIGVRLLPKQQYAVSAFLESAIRERKIHLKGNPNTVRSFLDEKDMSNWLWASLNLPASETILSVGSSRKVTIGELATYIAAQTGASVDLGNPNAFGDEYVADNASTLEYLKVSESKLWKESVDDCIEFLRGTHE